MILYELLVGALPFSAGELRQAGVDEIRRRLREQEPLRPSVRLSSLGPGWDASATRRRTEPKALRRELAGDLDWITLRALEKDPARRYPSPRELAEDIRRQRRDEPVLAHAPSARYRAAKFVRRHRLGVTAAGVMLTSLAVATVVSTTGLVRAQQAEARARTEAAAKGEVADFLKNQFKVSDPSTARGNTITARELLDKAARTINTQLSSEPSTQAELGVIISEVYRNLGLYAPAESLAQTALGLRERLLGDDGLETASAVLNLGNIYYCQANYSEAERLYNRAFEIRRRLLGPDDPQTLDCMLNLSALYGEEGRPADEETLATQTLAIVKRVLGPEDPTSLKLMTNLVRVYQRLGRYAEAEKLGSETVEIEKRVLASEHPLVLTTMTNLALAYQSEGRYDEAERLHTQTLAIRERVLGPKHPDTLVSMYHLACIAAQHGERAKAMEWLHRDVDGGDFDYNSMAGDAELASLRGPEFDALLAKVRRNAAAMRGPEANQRQN